MIVGQVFRQDVLGDIRKGWNGFVESGQIWALLIGIVAGYMLKSITSSH
jgi:fructose-specific phosphotransferase system IIC component